ncbi:MAG: ATP-binding protein [Myxococcales bacterium]|nr:ATP-binding protein [Myxococcales bacterium]
MATTIEQRIREVRRRLFVGRERELALFREAVGSQELPVNVISIHGPGGVGKSTLLHELLLHCRSLAVSAELIDARDLSPTPAALIGELARRLGPKDASIVGEIELPPGRLVLFLDTYENLAPIDRWIFRELLPTLRAQTLVVIAGRERLNERWRHDAAWRALTLEIELMNLSKGESENYLARLGIDVKRRAAVVEATCGHPLALTLAADVLRLRPETDFSWTSAPQTLRELQRIFLDLAPSDAHRRALEVAATVRTLSPALLAHVLEGESVADLFDWLAGLGFVDRCPYGLFPHELARRVIVASLEWRDDAWLQRIRERALSYYIDRLDDVGTDEQVRLFEESLYIYLHHPVAAILKPWFETNVHYTDKATDADRRALGEMVARHEGPDARGLFEHWLREQPENLVIVRDGVENVVGLCFPLLIGRSLMLRGSSDAAVDGLCRYLRERAPLREGEVSVFVRFWLDAESYQVPAPSHARTFLHVAQLVATRPRLALGCIAVRNEQLWSPMMTLNLHQRVEELDFDLGDNRYVGFGFDYRTVDRKLWRRAVLARFAVGAEQRREPELPFFTNLRRSEFDDAVRAALQSANDEASLTSSALTRWRDLGSVALIGSDLERARRLRELLHDALERLSADPNDGRYYQAVRETFLRPVAKQAEAAYNLGLPFSTYRRHLARGIALLCEQLWLGGSWSG